jgi:dihydroxyacetone kinase-like protein
MPARIDVEALKRAIAALAPAMEDAASELNAADGKLGDGDLGVTMQRGMRLVSETVDTLPEDLGRALMSCAQAFTKSSGSSYGTLLATGLMAMAKVLKGRDTAEGGEISGLVAAARDAMAARGKSETGAKTVLDSLEAISDATAGLDEAGEIAAAAMQASARALDAFRDQPARIGRARIFAERSVGLDDPGMLAMDRIVRALADAAR